MSGLPLISTCLCNRIVSGELIDLTAYLPEPCDDPTQSKSPLFLFMFQMSAQSSGLQIET